MLSDSLLGSLLDSYIVVPSKSPSPEPPERVVTIVFMGTREHLGKATPSVEYPNGALVAGFVERLIGRNEEVLYYNGPGVKADTQHLFTSRSERYQLVDTITGASMDDNVNDAMSYLLGQFSRDKQPTPALEKHRLLQSKRAKNQLGPVTKVNIIGWSRGGYTALKLAKAMSGRINADVNIFAIDPVPGPGNYDEDTITLEANVKHYQGVYAMHETSDGFSAVIPKLAEGNETTELDLCGMPGYHASVVGNVLSHDKQSQFHMLVEDVPKLVRDMAEKFLSAHGSHVSDALNLTSKQILQHYDNIRDNFSRYEEIAKGHYMKLPSFVSWLVGLSRTNPAFPKPVLSVNHQLDVVYAQSIGHRLAQRIIQLIKSEKLDDMILDADFRDAIHVNNPLDSIEAIRDFNKSFAENAQEKGGNLIDMWHEYRDVFEGELTQYTNELYQTYANEIAPSAIDDPISRLQNIYNAILAHTDHQQRLNALANKYENYHQDLIYQQMVEYDEQVDIDLDKRQQVLKFIYETPYIQRFKSRILNTIDAEIARLDTCSAEDPDKSKRKLLNKEKTQLAAQICAYYHSDENDLLQCHNQLVKTLRQLATSKNELSSEAMSLSVFFRKLCYIMMSLLTVNMLPEKTRVNWSANHTQRCLFNAVDTFNTQDAPLTQTRVI